MENVYDASKICRTCLTETEDARVIFEVAISEEQNIRITDFIRRLTSLKITKSDDLPDAICTSCVQQLRGAFNFAQMCIVSDAKLKLNRGAFLRDRRAENVKEDDDDAVRPHDDYEDFHFLLKDEDPSPADVNKTKADDDAPLREVAERLELRADGETLADPYKCEICEKTFVKSNQLRVHSRSHARGEDDKRFTCSECGQKFTYSYLLEKHTYKHRKQKPFPCAKCSKGCITAESLRRHMRTHDENYVKRTHVCGVCSKEFPYPSYLAQHMKIHTGDKPFLCSMCGKGFRQSGALCYHIRSHTGKRPHTCEVCKNCFTSPSVLKVHMRRHTDERPYVCDICGMAFRQSTDMKSHRRIHTGDKPVLCTICGKRLSSTGQLTVHIRSHTGEKPYPCRYCQKAFSTRTMLVKHERIHTGERPYACKICGKAFNQSSTLKTHMNVHRIGRKNDTGTTAASNDDGAQIKIQMSAEK